jgi:hypothetical protein
LRANRYLISFCHDSFLDKQTEPEDSEFRRQNNRLKPFLF